MKWLVHEDDCSPSSSANDKNDWSCTYNPCMYLHSMDRDVTFTFNLSGIVRPTYNTNKNNSNWLTLWKHVQKKKLKTNYVVAKTKWQKFPSYWKVHTYIRTYNAHYITWQWQDPAKGCQQSSDQHCCIIDWSGFLFGSSLLFWYFTVSDLSFRNIIAAPTMTWYLNTVDSPFA